MPRGCEYGSLGQIESRLYDAFTAPVVARFLFYSHDGLGLGHTRRHVAVARGAH